MAQSMKTTRSAAVFRIVGAALLVGGTSAVASASAGSAAVTPVQKVLELLNQLIVKGGADKNDEMARFASFKQWCASTEGDRTRSIKDAGTAENQLSADILKGEADSDALEQGISELDASVDEWERERRKVVAARKAEHSEFLDAHKDLSESVDAIERATAALKARSSDVPQALLEVRRVVAASARYPPGVAGSTAADDARRAAALLESATEDADGPPKANAYEFQSGNVVELLGKLHARFVAERRSLETEEMNQKHYFELLMQRLADDIAFAKDSRTEKTQMKARVLQDLAQGRGDLAERQRAKEADETYLRDLRADCQQKSADFERRQALRAAELEALRKAVAIVSNPTVAGAAAKHLPGALLQAPVGARRGAATVLAQMRGAAASDVPEGSRAVAQRRAAAALLRRAESAGSQLLATVADKVGADPFAEVKKLISDLLARLQSEASAEADHKGWCDEELSSNKQTRDQKSAAIADLTAQIDQLSALESRLTQEITGLGEQVAELDANMAEATRARIEDKAKNAATAKEATEAKAAVLQAMVLLREFYDQAAGATSLAQQKIPQDAPFVFDGAYKGMQSESRGVLGVLEVIESDFARLAADTRTSEAEAERQFKSFSDASAEDRETKLTQARRRGFEKTRATRALNQAKKDFEATQSELDAAMSYYDKLKPSCIGATADYAQRVAMREEEIQSLKEALRILDGEDLSPSAP